MSGADFTPEQRAQIETLRDAIAASPKALPPAFADADALVMRWVLANETTLRTHPQFTSATLGEIGAAMRAHFEAKRIAPERLARVKAQAYRELTAADREALARAAAKRARRGAR